MFGGKLWTPHFVVWTAGVLTESGNALQIFHWPFVLPLLWKTLSFQDPASSPITQDVGLTQASRPGPSEGPGVYTPSAIAIACDSAVNERMVDSPDKVLLYWRRLPLMTLARCLLIKMYLKKPGGETTPSVTDLLNYFLAQRFLLVTTSIIEKTVPLQNAGKLCKSQRNLRIPYPYSLKIFHSQVSREKKRKY